MNILLALFGLLILVSVLYWAINKLAPEPIKTYAIVILVVFVAFYLVALLTGLTPMPLHLAR